MKLAVHGGHSLLLPIIALDHQLAACSVRLDMCWPVHAWRKAVHGPDVRLCILATQQVQTNGVRHDGCEVCRAKGAML
jgi:hypothetical protein